MFRLIASLIIGFPSLIIAIYYSTHDLIGIGILFGGVALIVIVNYIGRELESHRIPKDGQTRGVKGGNHATSPRPPSKPISLILLYLLGIPTILVIAGSIIGNMYEQATLGYAPGFVALFLMVGGAIVGLIIGAVLSVK